MPFVQQQPDHGLILQDCACTLRGKPLFEPISIHAAPGTIVSLMGPSGAGKSTLLAAIAGTLDQAFDYTGSILLHGQDVAAVEPHRRGIGLLFQDDLLFPHMSVAENLLFALPRGIASAEKTARVDKALEQVEMQGLGDRKPFAISGGQRLRIALMRALLSEPKALLLDEPFSKLDKDLRQRIRAWVFAHIRTQAIPAVMVSHDHEDAMAADPDRVYTLKVCH